MKGILRAAISKLLLDEVFLSHNNLQSTIVDSIVKGDTKIGRHPIEYFGYRIKSALLTDCQPTKKIRDEITREYKDKGISYLQEELKKLEVRS